MKFSGKRGAFGAVPALRTRRVWRRVSLAIVVMFALLTVVPVANAADVSSSGFPLPGLGSLFGSERSLSWSGLPKQASGTAAGHSHTASVADTRSGKGVGNGRGKGKGELEPAPKPVPAKVAAGLSADLGDGVAPGTFASRTKYKGADGALHLIDTSLVAGKDGRLGKKADSQQVSFAPTAADPALMKVADGSYGVSFGLTGAAAVAASVSGSEAAYPAVFPGVDLRLTATRTGTKEDLILDNASASKVFTYPFVTAGGVTAKATADGVSFVDVKGVVRFTVPNGTMADAAVDAHGKHTAVSNGVRFTLVGDSAHPALQMTLDSAWLSDPARVFPVTVDPTVAQTASSTVGAPTVDSQYPQNGATLGTLTPELLATGHTQPGAVYSTPQFDFQVYDAASGGLVVDSMLVSSGDWTVPAGKLLWNHTYYWMVQAYDGQQYSATPVLVYFTVNVPQPPVTSALSQDSSGHGYDAVQGNYTTTATDADVPGAGPTLQVMRYYNSADPRTAGAFGASWSSIIDAHASEVPTAPGSGVVASVNVTYPDGSEVGYGRNSDGSFTPPLGRFAVLKQISGGYTLTDKNDTVYTFTAFEGGGLYGITAVADASGRSLTVTWANGAPTALVSGATGRALHLTWARPAGATAAHLSTVTTDPATSGNSATALTWTYNYTGDQLTSVCSPVDLTGKCTVYAYTSGTPFPNAVTNLFPHSYWRFDEQGGPTAASSVLVNEGNDNASYANVGYGQPTGLTGSPATSITFNGSSSYVNMPSNLVMNSTTASVAMWFKTTGTGTLFSTGHSPGGTPNPNNRSMPVLYVGTDGYLYGHYWNGSTTGIKSSAPVNDGSWHYVVLTAQTSTQSMFVDGAQVGSPLPGQLANVDPYDIVGAGVFNTSYSWPAGWVSSNWNYFSGQISDVAFFNQPLTSAQVGFLNTAGRHASSLLTSITRPSGAVEAKIAYEPLTGRVQTVTDHNGGSWSVEMPTITGSSQVFRSAVMAAAPTGFWRTSDPAGSTNAASQVAPDGQYASYSNVTLGQPGVFADSTVAGFDGTSSYLQLPSYAQPVGSAATVAMWFKTTTPTGMLLDYQFAPLGTTSPNGQRQMDAYVGGDGKLYGGFYTGSNPQMQSGVVVTDGKWHYMVLSGSGTSQSLYLDGKLTVSTTTSAPVQPGTQPYVYVGAGSTGTGWYQMPALSNVYFKGSIGDVAFYQSGLSATQVAQQWTASQNSSGMTPVLTTKVLDPVATSATMAFDGTTYPASAGKSWTLSGAKLIFQPDGNLVIYRNDTGAPILATGTEVHPNAILDFQTDGNLVMYADATKSAVLWSTGTNVGAGNTATFTPDGDLIITAKSGAVLMDFTSTVMDAAGVISSALDPSAGNRPLSVTDAAGRSTSYGYDTSGFLNTQTDGDGNTVTTGHDIRGNQVSRTTCQVQTTNTCSTAYYTYWPDDVTAQLTPDPRNDLVTSYRDGRSSSASDNTYLTSFTYDSAGNQIAVTTPPVPGFPNGRTSKTSYTASSTAAADSGTTPPGLVAKKTTDAGLATVTTYFHNGDVAQTTDPAGLITKYTYDNLGRMLTKTTVSDSYPSGLVTSYVSDGLNRVVQETNPPVTDRVTGAIHTAVTTTTYDADGDVTKTQVADTTGGDASRVTSSHFNALDQQDSLTDAAGNTTQYGYDPHGYRNKVVNANGVETDTAYDADGNVLSNTLIGYTGDPVSPSTATNLVTSSEAYDPAGRLASVTDANGNVSKYAYTDNGLISSITRYDANGNNPFVLQSNTYDAAGNLLSRSTQNGSDTTTYQVDAATRVASSTVDPSGVDRTRTYTYSPDDVVTAVNDRDGTGWNRTTTYGLDSAGRQTSKTVHAPAVGNGPAAAAGQVGSWPLNDGQSATAADSSGSGNVGTLSGGVSWSTDHNGSAVIDGSLGSGITTAYSAVDTSSSFTVSVWAKLTDTSSYWAVAQQMGTGGGYGFWLGYDPHLNAWALTTANADTASPSNWYSAAGAAGSAVVGTWTHLVGEYNQATGKLALYVNNVLQSRQDAWPTPFKTTRAVAIGGVGTAAFKGSIAGVRMYSRVLSSTEIDGLYEGTPGQQTQSGLAGQWNLADGNVGTAADASGANHALLVSGNASWSSDHSGSLTMGPALSGALTFTGVGGCLDDLRSNLSNGAVVDIWACNGTGAQSWSFNSNGTVTNGGYCLDINSPTTPGTANGTNVDLWTCNGGVQQQWQLQQLADGTWHLVNPNSGRCLDDPQSALSTGAQMRIWDCTGGASQRITGPTGLSGAASMATPIIDTTKSFSVSAWAKVNSTASPVATVVAQNGAQQAQMLLYADNGSTKNWNFALGRADTGWAFDSVTSGVPVTVGQWTHLVAAFDASTGTMSLYVNGALKATATHTARVASSGNFEIGKAKGNGVEGNPLLGSAAGVQAFNRVLSAAEVSSLYAGNSILPSDSTTTTSWKLDARGLTTSATDANGNVTTYVNDEAGHKTVTSAPSVPVETGGGGAVQAHPVTTVGYNTFGEPVETQDPDGNVITSAYDADGNVASVTQPNYTPPGSTTAITAVTQNTYDKLGNLLTTKDPVGNTISYGYDQRSLTATVTAPDSSVSHTTYDNNGEQLSVTDGNGATTQATWDYLGRKVTSTQLERYPTAASYTTRYAYDANGRPQSVTSPTGVITQTHYDNVGELSWSLDGANNKTTYGYDFLGDPSLTTLPDGTSTETDYNALQIPYQTIKRDPAGVVLTKTSSVLDGNGNPQSTTDARGNTTTFQYDASGVVSSETQPVSQTASITTSFGYDAVGNRTRYTDGNGNKWITTYNSWNLPESYIEPATSQYTAASDSTFTTAYDADGRPVSQTQPGGVALSTTYDAMGNVSGQSGTGAEAATATRSFTYDHLGHPLTAGTAASGAQTATSDTFTYNDRGALITASGAAGSSSFAYNGDGAMTSRTDASGATGYGYDTAGRLQTVNDGASGNTLTYQYNNLDQVSQINYGTGNNVRSFSYDSLHRLQSDTLKTSGGATVAAISYGYDNNSNLTSKTTTGFTGAAANTYTYDFANRLTSWNNGTTNVAYGYDNNGNRTQVGSAVYTYDARDQLTSDGTATYTYSARGTQTSRVTASGTANASFDAFGQTVSTGGQTYTYDALGRTVTDTTTGGGSRTLSYTGTANAVAGDGSNIYSRDPAGNIIGIGTTGQTTGSGLQALVDQHTDVVGAFTATGASLSGSTAFDPLGNTIGTSSLPGQIGYQSEWTEAANGHINMAARWYDPNTGQFTSRDTKLNNPIPTSANANPFAYGADNPLVMTDPSGHDPEDHQLRLNEANFSKNYEASQEAQQAQDAADENLDHCGPHGGCIMQHAHLWQTNPQYVRDQVNNYRITLRQRYIHIGESAGADALERCTRGGCLARKTDLWQHNESYAAEKTAQYLQLAAMRKAQADAAIAAENTPPPVPKAHHSGGFLGFVKSAATFVYHASGVSDIVDCVSHPSLGSCAQAALTVAMTVGTGGESMAGELVAEGIGKDLLETGAKDAVEGIGKDTAETAGKDALHTGEDNAGDALSREADPSAEAGQTCGVSGFPHSFIGSTKILMADGSSKPISQIKAGDTVTNSQPGKDGKTETHKVDAVIITYTDHDYTDVTVATPHGDKTITTTIHHPFYDLSQSAFVLAADLKTGDKLQTPDGTTTIRAVRNYHTTQVTYDLTIDGLHTYYVEAGDTPVLVHNCGTGVAPNGAPCACNGSTNPTDLDLVQAIATRAERKIGGSGAVPGTLKHAYADKLLTRYQGIYGNRGLETETSWLNGLRVPRGTAGSARPDVLDLQSGIVYDYKFIKNPGLGIGKSQADLNATNIPGNPITFEINP